MPSTRTLVVGALVAASVPVFEALVHFDPATITDWRTWLVGLGAGSVRQVAVFALAEIAARRARP